MSLLTFNASVKNGTQLPNSTYQIMPFARKHIYDSDITNVVNISPNNANILIHCNYITRPFNNNEYDPYSNCRLNLEKYNTLYTRIHDNQPNVKVEILIHLPESEVSFDSLEIGMCIIAECLENVSTVHFEIPSFAKSLINSLDIDRETALSRVIDYVIKCEEYCKFNKFKFVPDTAHLWSNGIETFEEYENVLCTWKNNIDWIHLNGNTESHFRHDKHCRMFENCNKIKCWKKLCEFISTFNVNCVAENTSSTVRNDSGSNVNDLYNEWVTHFKPLGFNIVENSELFSL